MVEGKIVRYSGRLAENLLNKADTALEKEILGSQTVRTFTKLAPPKA